MVVRRKELESMERWEKIQNSRYNKLHRWIKGEGVLGYLKKGWERVEGMAEGNEI